MGVNRLSIQRLVNKFTGTGDVADRPRRPRRRVTTQAQDHFIVTSHLRDKKNCLHVRHLDGSSVATEETFLRELYAAALNNCVEWLQDVRMRESLVKFSF